MLRLIAFLYIKLRWYCLGLVVAGMVLGLSGPVMRLKCRLAGEPFYCGQPASYWSRELRSWERATCAYLYSDPGSGKLKRSPGWYPRWPAWKAWLFEYMPRLARQLPSSPSPQILNGDVEALDVLVALLDDKDERVRDMACDGLGRMERGGKRAIPALLKKLNDPDMVLYAQCALREIAPEMGIWPGMLPIIFLGQMYP